MSPKAPSLMPLFLRQLTAAVARRWLVPFIYTRGGKTVGSLFGVP